jgi:hypothetical protein
MPNLNIAAKWKQDFTDASEMEIYRRSYLTYRRFQIYSWQLKTQYWTHQFHRT